LSQQRAFQHTPGIADPKVNDRDARHWNFDYMTKVLLSITAASNVAPRIATARQMRAGIEYESTPSVS
jgi:hypothetical protein